MLERELPVVSSATDGAVTVAVPIVVVLGQADADLYFGAKRSGDPMAFVEALAGCHVG